MNERYFVDAMKKIAEEAKLPTEYRGKPVPVDADTRKRWTNEVADSRTTNIASMGIFGGLTAGSLGFAAGGANALGGWKRKLLAGGAAALGAGLGAWTGRNINDGARRNAENAKTITPVVVPEDAAFPEERSADPKHYYAKELGRDMAKELKKGFPGYYDHLRENEHAEGEFRIE